MGVADGLVNGRDYEEIREYLRQAGVAEAELPSDHSFRTFQESVEYQAVKTGRLEATKLMFTAGAITGCAGARLAILQERTLKVLEGLLSAGMLENADMFKLLNFTLQFEKLQMQKRRAQLQLGETPVPASLGLRDMPQSDLDEILAAAADSVVAKVHARQAEEERLAAAAADLADDGDDVQDGGGKLRIVEDNRGSLSVEDSDDSLERVVAEAEDLADAVEEFAMAVGADFNTNTQSAARPKPTFKNSPSPATRQKARKRRRRK
jgi:hypothetical protein